jgi:protein-tyrosine phosphatase
VATFRVLVVCTANHCRSPIGQQLLAHDARERFGDRDRWLIESAGTNIPGRWPLHPYAATVLAERLPEVAEHESIQLSPALIARADLVLTATRQHRSAVVSSLPAAIGRTFTILQFARLCDEVPPISDSDTGNLGQELVVQARLARSSVQPVPGEQDDLPDPMGRGLQDFRLCADRLQNSIDRILRPLTLLPQKAEL